MWLKMKKDIRTLISEIDALIVPIFDDDNEIMHHYADADKLKELLDKYRDTETDTRI